MSSYKYASVVQLDEDDPRNDLKAGDVLLVEGKNEDGYTYTVRDPTAGDFVDIDCRVVGRLEADYRMSKQEIRAWAADQDRAVELAKEAA